MSDISNFKAELAALLEKYNATIGFSCGEGSDTFGLYDEKMVVDFYSRERGQKTKTHILAYGWGIDRHDLKVNKT